MKTQHAIVQMKKHRLFLVVAFVTLVLSWYLFLIDAKIAVGWIALVFLSYSYIMYRRRIGQELVTALFFALFITAYQPYVYTTQNLFIGKINLFPLVAWTAGLVLLRELYEHAKIKRKFLIFSILYIVGMLFVEYVGFYWLNIQTQGGYPSLFNLGILHGPPIIYIFYLSAGPLYLVVTDYLEVN